MQPLYQALVREARNPDWYANAGVPDSFDGRFEMVTLVMAAAMLRLEQEGDVAGEPMAVLTEAFVADMEAQIREVGIGDVVVGKHVGKMMSALGGRIGSLRAAETGPAREALLRRTAWSDGAPDDAQVARGLAILDALQDRLRRSAFKDLLDGAITA